MTTITRTLADGRELRVVSQNQSVNNWQVSIAGKNIGRVSGVHAFDAAKVPVRDGVRYTHFVKFHHDASFSVPISAAEWAQLEPQWEAGGVIDEGTRKTRPADAMRVNARRESQQEFNDENVEFG